MRLLLCRNASCATEVWRTGRSEAPRLEAFVSGASVSIHNLSGHDFYYVRPAEHMMQQYRPLPGKPGNIPCQVSAYHRRTGSVEKPLLSMDFSAACRATGACLCRRSTDDAFEPGHIFLVARDKHVIERQHLFDAVTAEKGGQVHFHCAGIDDIDGLIVVA